MALLPDRTATAQLRLAGPGPATAPAAAAPAGASAALAAAGAGALQPRPVVPIGPAGPPGRPPGAAHLHPLPPPASAARPRRRHWALLASFLLLVVAPIATTAWYLWTRAADQYVSTMAFSVRREDQPSGIDLLGGITTFTGGGASDISILDDYIRSPDMLAAVGVTLDLATAFSRPWPRDPVYAYDPSGTIEDLVDFWNRQVTVVNDDKSGIVTVRVAAFSPTEAKTIADAILAASSETVNRLSDQAREDATRYAREELDKAEARLREVSDRLTAFRTRTQLVDPQAEFAGRMGLLTGLQTELSEAVVALDLLRQNGAPSRDQRVRQGEMRVAALEAQIAAERARVSGGTAAGAAGAGEPGESYAAMVAEYERMTADRAFAEQAYTAAQATHDRALAEAQRQTRYLAAHVAPSLPEQSRRPDRPIALATVAAFALLLWTVAALVFYSLRDRG